jgi:hypothetical protein
LPIFSVLRLNLQVQEEGSGNPVGFVNNPAPVPEEGAGANYPFHGLDLNEVSFMFQFLMFFRLEYFRYTTSVSSLKLLY